MNFKVMMRALIFLLVVIGAVGTVKADPPSIMLEGVMFANNKPSAYIGGKLLRIGDEFDGYEIISIRHSGIRVRSTSDQKVYFMPMLDPHKIIEETEEKSDLKLIDPVETETEESAPGSDWKAGVSVMGAEEVAAEAEQPSESAFDIDTNSIKLVISMILLGIGFLLSIIASIWYIVACFQESVWWGVGALFVPLVELIFLFMHWERAKNPFLLSLLAALIMIGAFFLAPEVCEIIPGDY